MGERARVREIIEKVKELKDAFLEALDEGEREFQKKGRRTNDPLSSFSNVPRKLGPIDGALSNTPESQTHAEDDLGI